MKRAVVRVVSATVGLAALAAVLNGPAAGADAVPQIRFNVSPLYLGASGHVYGSGLTPVAAYELSVDSGGLGPAQLPVVDMTSSDAGSIDVTYALGTARPAPTTVHFTLTAVDDPTPVATLSLNVEPPQLRYGRACPGQTTYLYGWSIADGDYVLTDSSRTVGFQLSDGVVVSGTMSFPLPSQLPVGAMLSLIDKQTDSIVAVVPLSFSAPSFTTGAGETPWRQTFIADCFAPGEQLVTHAVTGISAPVVTANSRGTATIPVTLHPATQPVTTAQIAATGQTSGQSVDFGSVLVAGSMLFAGRSMSPSIQPYVLASPSPPPTGGYAFHTNYGNLVVEQFSTSGGSSGAWFSSGSGSCSCKLTLQTDGNLVYRTPAGTAIWSTGTANTGSNNRLVMANDGVLALTTGAGDLLWTNKIGLIRGTNGYTTVVSIGSSRSGATVTVTGRVYQRTRLGTLVRSAYRKIYLQRYVGGRWLNVASRTGDSTGYVKFAFTQARGYRYRFLATKSATAAAAYSPSTFR